MQTVIRRLWSLQNKNAAAPYWGDGGRGSTQFQETRTSLKLDSADNGAWPGRLIGWADVLSALGGTTLGLPQPFGRPLPGGFRRLRLRWALPIDDAHSLARAWRLLVPVNAFNYLLVDVMHFFKYIALYYES